MNEDPENEDLLPLLSQDLQEQLLLIYQNLSKDDLLQKCLGDHTQNANESCNATIWQLSLKYLHFGLLIVKFSAYIASGIFNEGYTSFFKVMGSLNIAVVIYAKFLPKTLMKHE